VDEALGGGRQLEREAHAGGREYLYQVAPVEGAEYVNLYGQDATDRNRAMRELRESEERYRTLFTSMSEGFAVGEAMCDASGNPVDFRFLEMNDAFERQSGLGRNILRRSMREVLPNLEPVWVQTYCGVALSGKPARFEGYNRDTNRHYSVFAYSPVKGRFAIIFSDITERKHAEERIRQAQKLESLGLLAGGVAHDFNNLLVGVIGNASLAEELLPEGHQSAALLQKVVKTGEQAAHLTRQMLAYSGKGQFLLEPVNLSELLPEIKGLVLPSVPKKILLTFELDEQLPFIEADRGQVQQIFMNLVLNAAEAIGSSPGTIRVKTGVRDVASDFIGQHMECQPLSPGRYVYLEVGDTGCGMDDGTKARIFDPFFSTKFTGRGLGLAAVSGIVRAHNGGIAVTTAPGAGSCFTVLFPVDDPGKLRHAAKIRSTSTQGAGTVLVVDDEALVRDMARQALERHGYNVLVADSGPAAIDVFKRHPGDIALVVLDLSMPGLSGEETLPELRKIRPDVGVIISSGYSESEAMPLFGGQRVLGFIQKPYTARSLIEKIESLLGNN
jgi:PAS domain S-box-containing protein